MKAAVVYNEITPGAGPDELDILAQVELAEKSLKESGHETVTITANLNLQKLHDDLLEIKPDFIFNLVESINNCGKLLHLAPAVFEYLKIPYTGVQVEGLFVTTNKPLTKQLMNNYGIPTPGWFELNESNLLNPEKMYLVKPKSEDGSLGFDDDLVFFGRETEKFEKINDLSPADYFIEEYIEGREFNVSVLGGSTGPEILPVPEMKFTDFPDGKPKILGFRAKWDENSFEYNNTTRSFIDEDKEPALVNNLKQICLKCWKVFNLSGFARVDFRVDNKGTSYVLEINANPCITPGSGFFSACEEKNYSFAYVTERIIEDAFRNFKKI